MTKNKDLIVFDFCDTLFDGQSISLFYEFLVTKQKWYKQIYIKIRNKFNRIPSKDSKKYKEFLLSSFNGSSLDYFNCMGKLFFDEVIKKRLNIEVLDRLKEHQKNQDYIVIVSGGLSCYLSVFCERFQIDYLISTELEFKEQRFTGKISKKECLGKEKVVKLKYLLNKNKLIYANTWVYSDHESDLPLFQLANKAVVVVKNPSQVWIKKSWEIIKIDS